MGQHPTWPSLFGRFYLLLSRDLWSSVGTRDFVMLWKSKRKEAAFKVLPVVHPRDRIYAVGDIHGRHDLLDALFEKIVEDAFRFSDNRQMRVIFLGDYVDRGDNSKDVLDRLVLVKERLADQTTFLAGNHEAALLGFLRDPVKNSNWLEFGGRQTLVSYGIAPPKSTDNRPELHDVRDSFQQAISDHLPFLQSLQRYVQSGDVIFVHAGLDPKLPVDRQTDDALLWGNSSFLERNGYPDLRVVHGHYDAYDPVITDTRVCVDTGAYYSGRLTAIRLDDNERLISVNAIDGI